MQRIQHFIGAYLVIDLWFGPVWILSIPENDMHFALISESLKIE